MKSGGPIRVLVVEDSSVARDLLVHILESDPEIVVAGTAPNGRRAVEAVEELRPSVVTMDIIMPEMDGLEATRRIMEKNPLPIIIVSGTVNRQEVSTAFKALEAGAVAAIPRPAGPGSPEFQSAARELLRTVKAMAEVRVVRRWPKPQAAALPVFTPPEPPLLVAIGASTGGPEALHRILSALPADFPLPILIVQHMAAGFLSGLCEWLDRSCPLPVAIAREGEPVLGGRVYIAPDNAHLGLSAQRRVRLSDAPPEKGLRPAVDFLFRSVRAACGQRAIAVLLTGMGADGVKEMKALKEIGAMTIAQDEASSVIYGMPGEAMRANAARQQLSPSQISDMLGHVAASVRKRGREREERNDGQDR
jgi:two-component system, chemotaxis family, protein-glutamate methylesterase/glutaminase